MRYPALERSAYFNYGAAGPLSRDALVAISHAYWALQEAGPFSIEASLWVEEEAAETRALLESEMDAPSGSIALVESICAACNIVLWGIDWHPDDHVVISTSENAGVSAIVENVAERFSLNLSRVPVSRMVTENPVREMERVLRPETRLVIVSHILQPTGELMPMTEISRLCRSNGGTMLLADGAQAVGAVPVSLRSLDADFYAFTGSKWMCGPTGLAGLYVRPDLQDVLRPTVGGWRGLSHNGGGRFHPDARRFEMATSAYPLMAGLRAAIALHRQAGGAQERLEEMLVTTRKFRSSLESVSGRGQLRCLPDSAGGQWSSGIISFAIDGARPAQLVRFLEARRILIREIHDPPCARACVHYFTTPEETGQLLRGIEEFLG
jgi:L-cysteine/cystine lyase